MTMCGRLAMASKLLDQTRRVENGNVITLERASIGGTPDW